jgi:hypothetical protein
MGGRALVNGTPRGGFPPSGFDPLRFRHGHDLMRVATVKDHLTVRTRLTHAISDVTTARGHLSPDLKVRRRSFAQHAAHGKHSQPWPQLLASNPRQADQARPGGLGTLHTCNQADIWLSDRYELTFCMFHAKNYEIR